jgi:hypothetical protein
VKDIYTSAVGFVTAPLAPLYGITGNFSADTSTMVELDPTLRSGLLTQPGFLSSYITDEQPDIIHRGVFIAQRILCVELPPPSPLATPRSAGGWRNAPACRSSGMWDTRHPGPWGPGDPTTALPWLRMSSRWPRRKF